ncbi:MULTISPECIES: helix-hairpin-helix domain-containing protein [Bacillus]|uniref:helix-hairpin-helix domain-containing protein n=1 Tax=Bacillus TaxID=1386 RepID=UPI0015967802|nr:MULTISPECIES: helix-hairpin-helix domain-containing protein [Bacillus]
MKERLLEQKYAIVISVIAIAIIGYMQWTKDHPTLASESNLSLLMEQNLEEQEDNQGGQEIALTNEKPEATIFVDVKGAVKYEGVYHLLEGERIMDAIEKAGGLVEGADHRKINFAAKLQDQMVVFIPLVGEEVDASSLLINSGVSEESGNKDGKININTATVEELQSLAGIGQAKAKAIVAYREDNGYFKSLEELTNVSGIGQKSLENIRDEITVGN